jgi:hypothetical protein
MKIMKWLQQYYDYLFDVTPRESLRAEGAEGMVRAMPLFIAILLLAFILMYLANWFFKAMQGNSLIH